MPVIVFLFFFGCWWLGAEGFPRFYDWTVSAGYREAILQACPFMVSGGFALAFTSIAMLSILALTWRD